MVEWGEIPKLVPPTEEEKKKATENAERLLKKLNLEKSNSAEYFNYVSSEWDATNVMKNCINGLELINKDIPPVEWIVEGIIPVGASCMFGGAPASKKSFFALHLAICIANGKKVFNHFNVKKGRVLYIDEENGEVALKERLLKLSTKDTLELENISFLICKDLKLDNAELAEHIEQVVQEFEPTVIILDSMVRFFEGDENSSRDVRRIFSFQKYIKTKYGISFAILHHTRKTKYHKTGDDLRGSGDFLAQVEVSCMLNPEGDNKVIVTQSKNRHIKSIPKFGVDVIDKPDGTMEFNYCQVEYAKQDIKKKIGELCADSIKIIITADKMTEFKRCDMEQKMNGTKFTKSAFDNALKLLVKQGMVTNPEHGLYVVSKDLLNKQQPEVSKF